MDYLDISQGKLDTSPMRIDVLTLFPEVFSGYLKASILQRAQEANIVQVYLHDIRDYAAGKHRVTDEPPYGGGGGMVLKPEPIFAAVEAIGAKSSNTIGQQEAGGEGAQPHPSPTPSRLVSSTSHSSGPLCPHPVILLTPQGRQFNQAVAQELARHERLILICGRYEGVDERVRRHLVTDEISIGDYVLTGGELPALIVIDAVTRLLPGTLGADGAAETDSFAAGLLEGPHYTRPDTFRGWSVPEVLRSGHAARIAQWRRQQALRRTWQRRPELLLEAELDESDRYFLKVLAEETLGNS